MKNLRQHTPELVRTFLSSGTSAASRRFFTLPAGMQARFSRFRMTIVVRYLCDKADNPKNVFLVSLLGHPKTSKSMTYITDIQYTKKP